MRIMLSKSALVLTLLAACAAPASAAGSEEEFKAAYAAADAANKDRIAHQIKWLGLLDLVRHANSPLM